MMNHIYKHGTTFLVLLLFIHLCLFQGLHSSSTTIDQKMIYAVEVFPLDALYTQEPLYVNNTNTGGPWTGTQIHPYKHIQDAIDNATTHTTIYISPGIYNETVIVDKSLAIVGENKTHTIIDGFYQPKIITLITDHITLNNLTLRNSGGYQNNAGIFIDSQHNLITHCEIYRTKTGIYLNTTENNTIQDCSLYTNGEGIYLNNSSNTIIQTTCFTHNGLGLNLLNSYGVLMRKCSASTNGIGFFLSNSYNCTFVHCAAYNNNDNQQGVCLKQCQRIMIIDSNLLHNGVGARIIHSSHILLSHCDVLWNTHFGIKLERDTAPITITNCNIAENLRFGIYSEESTFNVQDTNIYQNLCGLYSENSQCTAKHNWWGSWFGPALFEQPLKQRIQTKQGRTQVIPWLHKKNTQSGSSWNVDTQETSEQTVQPLEIQLPGLDSDGDHAPDWWEEKYGYNPNQWNNHETLDPDQDGLTNIQECFADHWGAHPFQKDIFLEFDWMPSHMPGNPINKPSESSIEEVQELFAGQGITLHIDIGNLGGGEEIPYQYRFSFADLRNIYWNYFLHNDLNNPRKGIFHYGIVCDYGPVSGFAFVGWDHLDGFCISAQILQENQPSFERDRLIIGGSVHELGHTLGNMADDFDGNDNLVTLKLFSHQQLKYLSYKSCMNYYYTYKLLSYSDGSHGRNDYDDWGHLDFSFFKNTHFEWPKPP